MAQAPSLDTGASPRFTPGVAHPARVYASWLGGKDHYPADRKVAQEVAAHRPQVVVDARANRAFLARAGITARSHAQVTALFGGLPPVPPGIVPVTEWRPGHAPLRGVSADIYAGLATTRRPGGHPTTS